MLHLLLMQPTVPQDSSHRSSAEQQNKKSQVTWMSASSFSFGTAAMSCPSDLLLSADSPKASAVPPAVYSQYTA
jgi:hypothetical protein